MPTPYTISEGSGVRRCLKTGADLSANQSLFVKQGAAEDAVIAIAAATDVPLGVQITKPAAGAGQYVDVVMSGEGVEVIAGAAIALGAIVQTNAAGKAITAVATGYPVGRAMQAAGADGDKITIVVDCAAPVVKA